MQPTATAPLAHALLAELKRETELTRRVLERLPEASFNWQPHPKSYTAGQLAAHLVDILSWVEPTFGYPEFNMATDGGEEAPPAATRAELLARLTANSAAAQAALAAATPEDFAFVWTFRNGEEVVLQQPRADVVREWFFNHSIHHRAQLQVYLRLLNVPVPSIYGPTADELQPTEAAPAA
jgi:uncharacterized damage-inducible protein DinB